MSRSTIIIPDIHADKMRLERSLAPVGGNDRIVFLGDLIDAYQHGVEPDDGAVLSRVKQLVDEGRAQVVMGNHELNAILFHTMLNGKPLREHSASKTRQHQSFIDTFGICTEAALLWRSWFLTFPLWIEQDGLRLVHACWHDEAVDLVKQRRPDGRLLEDDLPEVADKETSFAKAVGLLTTGPETTLPDKLSFVDAKGEERREMRLAWWRSGADDLSEIGVSIPDASRFRSHPIPDRIETILYPAEAPPVAFGHYKMAGKPQVETHNAICLDYPETPVVYAFSGEAAFDTANLRRV